MAERACPHTDVVEEGELVCRDCGLVLGPIFHHLSYGAVGRSWKPPSEKDPNDYSFSRSDEKVRDSISNALARIFLDSDELIEEAVRIWKQLSRHLSSETSSGRRQMAYVLWDALTSKHIIREKADIEAVCGAKRGSISSAEKRRKSIMDARNYHPPSKQIHVLGSWLNIPYRQRRAVSSYMRTFEFENHYLSRKPETLAAASLLYVCSRLKGKGHSRRPKYMDELTPSSVAALIDVDQGELKSAYEALPKFERGRKEKPKVQV